jgi:hypothetical protein
MGFDVPRVSAGCSTSTTEKPREDGARVFGQYGVVCLELRMVSPAGLAPATSGLEMLTRIAAKWHYLCCFVSALVSLGDRTDVDNRGQEWTSWVQLDPVREPCDQEILPSVKKGNTWLGRVSPQRGLTRRGHWGVLGRDS